MTDLEQARAFLVPKFRQIAHFLAKQGIAMAGNLVYGLLCVRLLPIPDYAKFAVLFGYMGSLTVLLDLGISGTLAPLVGEQVSDLRVIADYTAAIRRLTIQLYGIAAPVAAAVFVFLVRRQRWGAWAVAEMLAALLVTAWFARLSATYGSVLILRKDRNFYYRQQIAGSLGSLALLATFWAFHRVSLPVAIGLNLAQVLYIAVRYWIRARILLGEPGVSSPRLEAAVKRLAMPAVPGAIFFAVQGQITLMLITFFGQNAASVADVGALSRLNQILVLFTQMNPVLVEPFFARLPLARLKKTYLLSLLVVSAVAATGVMLSFLFPEIFLWILGPKYRELRVDAGLVMLGACIRYVNHFLWVVHTARRFVYWWNNFASIALILLVQAFFVWKFDMSTVRSVLLFNVATSLASLIVCAMGGAYGFWRGPQKSGELRREGLEGF